MILIQNYSKFFLFMILLLIYIPRVKKLTNVELLKELHFYDDLSIIKNKQHLVAIQEVIKLKL